MPIREKVREIPQRCKQVPVQFYYWSGKGEHLGFVLIAFIDVFHLHEWLFVVSVWLLVTGVPALCKDIRRKED